MRRLWLFLWLLLPVPVVVWHYGPGQRWLARDRAHDFIVRAVAAEAGQDWEQAGRLYQEAAGILGRADPVVRARLDMAQVRMQYRTGGAVDAIDGADRIVADAGFSKLPGSVQREARELAGRLHYYAAWVLRLEGARRDLWLEEVEMARQNFRLLTETSHRRGDSGGAALQQRNLENAVKLQRMGLTELMARPLPEDGQPMAGQGLSEQMARRRGQRGKGRPGTGEIDEEGPPQDGAGTSLYPPGEGS